MNLVLEFVEFLTNLVLVSYKEKTCNVEQMFKTLVSLSLVINRIANSEMYNLYFVARIFMDVLGVEV